MLLTHTVNTFWQQQELQRACRGGLGTANNQPASGATPDLSPCNSPAAAAAACGAGPDIHPLTPPLKHNNCGEMAACNLPVVATKSIKWPNSRDACTAMHKQSNQCHFKQETSSADAPRMCVCVHGAQMHSHHLENQALPNRSACCAQPQAPAPCRHRCVCHHNILSNLLVSPCCKRAAKHSRSSQQGAPHIRGIQGPTRPNLFKLVHMQLSSRVGHHQSASNNRAHSWAPICSACLTVNSQRPLATSSPSLPGWMCSPIEPRKLLAATDHNTFECGWWDCTHRRTAPLFPNPTVSGLQG